MISYRENWGLWWPDWDQKAEQNHAYILKHLGTMDFAISQCKERRVCVQAGGHVGIWAKRLSEYFEIVCSSEPEFDLLQCLAQNCSHLKNVFPICFALSDKQELLRLERSSSSGSNRISIQGEETPATSVDNFCLHACDAIFLDIEGHELQALQGAEQTIKKFKPVIQVEELDTGEAVSLFLHELGYRPHPEKQGKDRVYLPC